MNNEIQCPNCGTFNNANASFCVHCGASLKDAKPASSFNNAGEINNIPPKKHHMGWIILIIVVILAVIGGIWGWQVYHQSPTNKATQTTSTQTITYDKLSEADKKKVHFKFTLSQDDTKDNTADSVYVISMKVTNKTNKNIKFHQDKFVYLLPVDKILSSKKGLITVKAGQQATIDQLFEDVDEQGTVGSGIIEYLNSDNKLAYANFVNNVATSNNLTNKKLIEQNKNTTGASSYSTVEFDSTNSTTGSDDTTQSAGQSTSTSSSDSVVIHNSSEAIAAAKASYGSNTYEGRSLTWGTMSSNGSDLMDGGYYWVKADDGTTMSGTTLSYFVYPDGDVVQQ